MTFVERARLIGWNVAGDRLKDKRREIDAGTEKPWEWQPTKADRESMRTDMIDAILDSKGTPQEHAEASAVVLDDELVARAFLEGYRKRLAHWVERNC